MWEISRSKFRSKKRAQLEFREGGLRNPQGAGLSKAKFSRVSVELKPIGEVGQKRDTLPARLFWLDFRPEGLRVFTSEPLITGARFSLTINAPLCIYGRVEVVSCQVGFVTERVLSETRYPYRVTLRWIFDSATEEATLHSFWEKVRRELIYSDSVAS